MLAGGLVSGGCSATDEIAGRANRMQASAQSSIDLLAPYIEADDSTPPGVAREVVDHQRAIIGDADGIGRAVTRVADIAPWWARLLTVLAAAAVAGALVYVGMRTGLFALVGGLVQFITPRTRQQAALMVDTADPSKPETARELIASLRGADPALNRAVLREKARRAKVNPSESSPGNPPA